MSENFTRPETLIQWLDGELPAGQLPLLEQELASSQALQERLENLRAAREGLKMYGIRQQVKAIHAEMIPQLRAPRSRYVSMVRWSARIAALIVLCLGLSLLYQYVRLSTGTLYQDNYRAFTLRDSRGGASGTGATGSASGAGATGGTTLKQLFRDGQMADMIASFQKSPDPSVEDCFLAGNAFLDQNRPAEAIQAFLLVQKKNAELQTHLFEDDTEYYLAMSYLKNGQTSDAIPIFEKIHQNPAHPYYDKVGGWFLRKLHWLPAGK